MSPLNAIEWGLIAAGISVAIIAVVNGLAGYKARGAELSPIPIAVPINTR